VLLKIRKGVNYFAAQIFRRLEFAPSASPARTLFQFGEFLLRVLVRLDHAYGQGVIFVNEEDEDRNLRSNGTIEFHLGNRNVVAFRFVTITPAKMPM
jgi:hypothetical protein